MKRKKRPPVVYVTEGLGPRLNEITRWSYSDPEHQGRQWAIIVHLNPKNAQELIYESGPLVGGHWGHDAHGTTQLVTEFLASRSAPVWTQAPREALREITTVLERKQRRLEQELTSFLSSLVNPNMYENWVLYKELTSLTSLGKYGDEFSGLLVGSHLKDGRVLLFEKSTDVNRRISVAVGNSEHVLAEFTSVAEMRYYLANDEL